LIVESGLFLLRAQTRRVPKAGTVKKFLGEIMEKPIVFISHASPDDDFVRELDVRLTARGMTVINDERSFMFGDNLVQDIFDKGIAKADACVLVLSSESVNRPWPREELDAAVVHAVTRGMKLLPIFLDDVSVPAPLQHRVYYKVGDRSDEAEINRIALRVELAVRGMEAVPPGVELSLMKRVKLDLLVRLQGHFENLRPLFFHGSVDISRWRAAHQDIYNRAMQADVIDALGDDYPKFMSALRAEAKSINIEEEHQQEYSKRIIDKDGTKLPGADAAKREYKALFMQLLAETILTYTSWVNAFGDPTTSAEYERSATRWRDLATHMLGNL
jgi:TIR domain